MRGSGVPDCARASRATASKACSSQRKFTQRRAQQNARSPAPRARYGHDQRSYGADAQRQCGNAPFDALEPFTASGDCLHRYSLNHSATYSTMILDAERPVCRYRNQSLQTPTSSKDGCATNGPANSRCLRQQALRAPGQTAAPSRLQIAASTFDPDRCRDLIAAKMVSQWPRGPNGRNSEYSASFNSGSGYNPAPSTTNPQAVSAIVCHTETIWCSPSVLSFRKA